MLAHGHLPRALLFDTGPLVDLVLFEHAGTVTDEVRYFKQPRQVDALRSYTSSVVRRTTPHVLTEVERQIKTARAPRVRDAWIRPLLQMEWNEDWFAVSALNPLEIDRFGIADASVLAAARATKTTIFTADDRLHAYAAKHGIAAISHWQFKDLVDG